jgi:hypothetical protein
LVTGHRVLKIVFFESSQFLRASNFSVSLGSFEFFPEPFPSPRIIKPYRDHHHTKPQAGRQTYNPHYSSFLVLLLQSCIIYRINSTMSFFGVQMENAFADEITMKYISFYNNSYNPPDYLPNSREGRNHLLVISSAL